MELTIVCADIGSIKNGRFGWALRDHVGPAESRSDGGDIGALVSNVGRRLIEGRPVALGFECPLFVPLPEDPEELTRARNGEGNRAWSASAGAGALATGLAEVTWILKKLREDLGTTEPPTVTLDWSVFVTTKGLFIWEAVVTGNAKSNTHCGDARSAIDAFADALPDPTGSNAIVEASVYSLIGAGLLRAGWDVPQQILELPALVIAAEPRHCSGTRSALR